MSRGYIHALRFRWLNRFYDLSVQTFTRENTFRQCLLKSSAPQAGERVLDLGCGSGTFVQMLKAAYPGADIHGLDGDADILARARRKAKQSGTDVQLHLANALNMPFPDNGFDQVISSLFFHHLDRVNKIRVLEEARRILRPGGRLLTADFGRAPNSFQWLLSWPVRCFDGLAVTRDSFRGRLPEMIREAGFSQPQSLAAIQTAVGTIHIVDAVAAG